MCETINTIFLPYKIFSKSMFTYKTGHKIDPCILGRNAGFIVLFIIGFNLVYLYYKLNKLIAALTIICN